MSSSRTTLPPAPSARAGIGTIIGLSDWATGMRRDIIGVAAHSSNVLITGPNGTGKEVVARAIHAHSPRAQKPFIPVDCAAFVGSLFPSHMFGHVRGAFTGAEYEAMGCFRAADGGTLFLDEIGELELPLQAKLLRVLQERVVIPVGGVTGIPVDVRIVAATNRDLPIEVRERRFREDLFYRLNVVLLETVGLRNRREDIDVLADHFLTSMASEGGLPLKRLSADARRLLAEYHWPGNVRQLKNVLERAVIYTSGEVIARDAVRHLLEGDRPDPEDESALPSTIRLPGSVGGHEAQLDEAGSVVRRAQEGHGAEAAEHDEWLRLDDLERYHIQQTLQYTFFNQTAAARLLGTTARILAGKIKRFGLDTSASRRGRPRKDDRPGQPR